MLPFLQTRWRGEAPLETVFWRDMLAAGTAVNIASAVAAWAMLAADMNAGLALAVYMAPAPWNIFLFLAVWRSAERDDGAAGLTAKVIATIWLITMFVL